MIRDILKHEFTEVYQVGGSVRDTLLKKSPKDIDFIVVGDKYDNIVNKLSKHGKCDIVGKSFGVVKFQYKDEIYDITIPRKERSTGNGHCDFSIETENVTLLEDLQRRDFTINAILMTLDGKVVDPLKGTQDLSQRLIKPVFDNCFNEDPLRMLRAIRFACQLNFELDEYTIEKIRENASLINTVSVERIREELNKILLSDTPDDGVWLLDELDLLKYILPELEKLIRIEQNKKYHIYNAFNHTLSALRYCESKDLDVRLAVLLHDIGKAKTKTIGDDGEIHFYNHEEVGVDIAKDIMKRLKYSNETINLVCILIREHMFDLFSKERAMKRLIARVGKENIWKLYDLRIADRKAAGREDISMEKVERSKQLVRDIFEKENAFKVTDLKIDGHDVMTELEVGPGRHIGDILRSIFEEVLDEKIENNREVLMQRIKEFA